ncbi:hypothetical protein KDK77_01290 [bacterium]|nr:hypothetical protein [bacterium]
MFLRTTFRFFCGIALLPLCWAMGKTLVVIIATGKLYALCAGAGFFCAATIMTIRKCVGGGYIFLHELNHAVWSVIANTRVISVVFGKNSGYVEVDRESVLGALAPYFFPIPLLIVAAAHGIFSILHIMNPALRGVEFFALGLGIGWHVVSSVVVLFQDHRDISQTGLFFSLSIIYTLFLFWCGLFTTILSPYFYLADFFAVSYKEITFIYGMSCRLLVSRIW